MRLFKNIQWALMVILVFFLPISKRLELRNSYTLFAGHYHEYITPSIYIFDFILLALVLILFLRIFCTTNIIFRLRGIIVRYWKTVALLSSIIFLFIAGAHYQFIANYYAVHWIIGIGIFSIVAYHLNQERGLALIYGYIASALLQSVIGISQVLKGGSLGLSLLGEQQLDLVSAGVAKINIFSHEILRAYGTLPHPNILSIFLFLAFAIVIDLGLSKRVHERYLWIIGTIISIGILCTFSRFIWVGILIGLLIYISRLNKAKVIAVFFRYRWIAVSILFVAVPFLFVRLALPDTSGTLELRHEFMRNAYDLISLYPFGVGIGNYTIVLREIVDPLAPGWMYQPVHNTFMLALVELGYLRWTILLVAGGFVVRRILSLASLWIGSIVLVLVLLLFFEHAFWDMRQVILMVAFFLAYAYRSGSW